MTIKLVLFTPRVTFTSNSTHHGFWLVSFSVRLGHALVTIFNQWTISSSRRWEEWLYKTNTSIYRKISRLQGELNLKWKDDWSPCEEKWLLLWNVEVKPLTRMHRRIADFGSWCMGVKGRCLLSSGQCANKYISPSDLVRSRTASAVIGRNNSSMDKAGRRYIQM